MINGARRLFYKITPLCFRRRVGPILGLVVYLFRTKLRGRSWEPSVLSINSTLELILKNNLSVVRFGDGEISLIEGTQLGFQKHDEQLSKSLIKTITTNRPGLLCCIPNIFGNIDNFSKTSFWFTLHTLLHSGHTWKKLIDKQRIYGDAFITRPYLTFTDKRDSEKSFKLLKEIWKNKNVLLIEGGQSRIGVGNDLLNDCASIERILCPPENAWYSYNKILEAAEQHAPGKIVLISLGPTAKPLTLDLFEKGFRVIDIGHIDMEYEMFRRNSDVLVRVDGKYFNEINERNPINCIDEIYQKQIIARI